MNGKDKNAEKEKNGKLICFLVKNETVYRAWRTFLQAAVGVLAAGLFEYLAGRFTGQSPKKVIPYFITAAVAAGISAVMNRGGKKGDESPSDPGDLAEKVEEITDALFPKEVSEKGEQIAPEKPAEPAKPTESASPKEETEEKSEEGKTDGEN